MALILKNLYRKQSCMNEHMWVNSTSFCHLFSQELFKKHETYSLDCEGLFKHTQAKNSPKATNGGQSIFNLPANPRKQWWKEDSCNIISLIPCMKTFISARTKAIIRSGCKPVGAPHETCKSSLTISNFWFFSENKFYIVLFLSR